MGAELLESIPVFSMRPQAIQVEGPALPRSAKAWTPKKDGRRLKAIHAVIRCIADNHSIHVKRLVSLSGHSRPESRVCPESVLGAAGRQVTENPVLGGPL